MTDVGTLKRRVFAQCRQLGLDDDARREAQQAATGCASLSTMTEAQLRDVIAHLEAAGARPGKWREADPRADQRLIHVIWRLLGEAGAVKTGPAALRAFIANPRFTAKWGETPTAVRFLTVERARDVIEALKDVADRNGVRIER